MYIPWGRTRILFITELLFKLSCLTAFPLFLPFITSLINNSLNLLFGSQGTPRRWKPLLQKNKWGDREEFLYQGGLHRDLLSLSPPFCHLSPVGSKGRTRKGINFQRERLFIDTRGLSFGGCGFSLYILMASN